MQYEAKLPSFFIVGAAKAGTTSLYHYLSQHPQVYMSPIKEPNFFATDIDTNTLRQEVKERMKLLDVDGFLKGDMRNTMHRAFLKHPDEYKALFRFAQPGQVSGEASASYLWSKEAARNIHTYLPTAKIIIVLRHPALRMYSHYLMDRRMAVTELSFEDAIKADSQNPHRSWGSASLYHELGEYYEQVKRYYDIFPASQILVLFSDEMKAAPVTAAQQVYAFIGVDHSFTPDTSTGHNEAVVPRNGLIGKIISVNYLRVKIRRALKRTFLKKHIKKALFEKAGGEPIPAETYNRLTESYRENIQQLSSLLQKDLHTWLQKR